MTRSRRARSGTGPSATTSPRTSTCTRRSRPTASTSWWLDWCCDESRVSATTLPGDAWINSLYAQRQRDRGTRWLPLSRIGSSMWDQALPSAGAWAEHRNSIHFTGDSDSTWEMLGFQTRFSAAEGAGIGHPYVSHDIGGFLGDELPDDLYARWVQLGAMQPILRLHSDHAPRLPWEYGGRAGRIAGEFMRLRASLVPYLYTLAREAYDTGLPLVRAMYLGWPLQRNAYRFDRQYMLGDRAAGRTGRQSRRSGAKEGLVPARAMGRHLHREQLHGLGRARAQCSARADAGVRPRRRDRGSPALCRLRAPGRKPLAARRCLRRRRRRLRALRGRRRRVWLRER